MTVTQRNCSQSLIRLKCQSTHTHTQNTHDDKIPDNSKKEKKRKKKRLHCSGASARKARIINKRNRKDSQRYTYTKKPRLGCEWKQDWMRSKLFSFFVFCWHSSLFRWKWICKTTAVEIMMCVQKGLIHNRKDHPFARSWSSFELTRNKRITQSKVELLLFHELFFFPTLLFQCVTFNLNAPIITQTDFQARKDFHFFFLFWNRGNFKYFHHL